MTQDAGKAVKSVCAVAAVLTANCNLACAYCYQNTKRPRRMSWSTLKCAIDLLLGSDRDEVALIFYGGEPLLEFELIRRALGYVESARPAGKSVGFSLLTNGTLMTRTRAAFLAEHDLRTQISLDGVETAQRQRGLGTFAILDRLLSRLLRDHRDWFRKSVSISMTVSPGSMLQLAEGVEYLLAKGVQHIGFSPVLTNTSEWRLDQIEELRRQFGLVFDRSLEHYRRTHEVPVEVLRRYSSRGPDGAVDSAMCTATLGEKLGVDVDGQTYGCAIFAESFQTFPGKFLRSRLQTLRLGYLGSTQFGEKLAAYPSAVRSTELFHGKGAKYSSYGRCRDCGYLGHCQICPMAIGHIPGNTDPRRVPDFQCAFNRVCDEYRNRFPAQHDLLSVLSDARNARRLDPQAVTGPQ
jgi:uncharacterized protein